jgi:hypothetical protein
VPTEREQHRFLAEEVGRAELAIVMGGLMVGLFLASGQAHEPDAVPEWTE